MKYIVLDLEATCWKDRSQGKQNEIIEIGALAIDEAGEIIGEFSEFIRPVIHPQLSPFCTELTSITQDQVEEANVFPQVIKDFQDWIGVGKEEYWLGSWGYYDKKQFNKDCTYHQLDTAWLTPHLSIKHQHQKILNLTKPLGMAGALRLESFDLEGTHHRGIDDARNISKIFIKYLGKWKLD